MKIYSVLGCLFLMMMAMGSEIEPNKIVTIDLEDAPEPTHTHQIQANITSGSKKSHYKSQQKKRETRL